MIPYGHQSIDESDINEVIGVLKSDWLTQGPKVLEFEKNLASYCGVKYAVTTTSGTSALHLSYLTANLGEGDEVITTPNTFAATSNMLLACGAKPVFCDIRLDTYNIDEDKIEELITEKTKAIIPVHFAGQPCEMDKILKIAKKYNLLVIEDACHALGAEYKNKKIGGLSDMTIFSFHPVKPITTGEGGAVLTNNEEYYKKLILLRNHGIEKDESGFNVMRGSGYNYRMTDIQAALGISQLKKLDFFIQKRRQIIKWYNEVLPIDEIILPQETKDVMSGWHLYVIRVKNPRIRNDLMMYLKKNNIGANFHYPAVYSHPDLNNEEMYQNSCITLPCYTQLKPNEIKYIGHTIKNFLGRRINI